MLDKRMSTIRLKTTCRKDVTRAGEVAPDNWTVGQGVRSNWRPVQVYLKPVQGYEDGIARGLYRSV